MAVTHFRDLRVYTSAFEAGMQIYELSKNWPKDERYSLTDQIRRSSRSICGPIAEAWRKRRYPAHFVSKLSDGDSEAAATQAWLDFAKRCGYLQVEAFDELNARYEQISGGIVRMMAEPDKWCFTADRIKEEASPYGEAND